MLTSSLRRVAGNDAVGETFSELMLKLPPRLSPRSSMIVL